MATIEKILFKEDGIWKEYSNLSLDALKFRDSKRGISLISLEGQNRLTSDVIRGFCHKRFKSNFVINGMDTNKLTVGQLIQIGGAVIKVTKLEKECLSECPIIKDLNVSCTVNTQVIFADIEKEGLANKGDQVLV